MVYHEGLSMNGGGDIIDLNSDDERRVELDFPPRKRRRLSDGVVDLTDGTPLKRAAAASDAAGGVGAALQRAAAQLADHRRHRHVVRRRA